MCLVPSPSGDRLSPYWFESWWSGSNPMLFWRRSSSYRLQRSSSSRSGNLRLRCRGIRAAGTHVAPNLVQLVHGNLRVHFTLRCWQRTQASTRSGFESRARGPNGDTAVDMITLAVCLVQGSFALLDEAETGKNGNCGHCWNSKGCPGLMYHSTCPRVLALSSPGVSKARVAWMTYRNKL